MAELERLLQSSVALLVVAAPATVLLPRKRILKEILELKERQRVMGSCEQAFALPMPWRASDAPPPSS